MGLWESTPQPQLPGQRVNQNVNTVRHYKFGEVSVHRQYNRQYMTVVRSIPSHVRYEDWDNEKQQFLSAPALPKENLLLPTDHRLIRGAPGVCCPNSDAASLTFYRYDLVLSMEIDGRRHSNRPYSQAEIYYFLQKLLITSTRFLSVTRKRLGDIRPANILVNESGSICLINRYSWPGQDTGFNKLCETSNEKVYIAPEEVELIHSRKMSSNNLDPSKLDAFSIGLTVLDMILLQSNDDLYGSGCSSLDRNTLNNRVSSITTIPGRNYKPWLQHLVEFMTQPLPAIRNSANQTLSIMSPYSHQIENMQPFQPTWRQSHAPLLQTQRSSSRR